MSLVTCERLRVLGNLLALDVLFVGRAAEVQSVCDGAASARVVTVVGTGVHSWRCSPAVPDSGRVQTGGMAGVPVGHLLVLMTSGAHSVFFEVSPDELKGHR